MTDAVLVVDGLVRQVWRNTPTEGLEADDGVLYAMSAGEAVCGMLWDGGTLSLPEPGPDPVPARISRMQARRALLAAGKLGDVEAAISSADMETQITWQDASHLHRVHPMVVAITAALGWTEQQTDDLFRAAALIT